MLLSLQTGPKSHDEVDRSHSVIDYITPFPGVYSNTGWRLYYHFQSVVGKSNFIFQHIRMHSGESIKGQAAKTDLVHSGDSTGDKMFCKSKAFK